MIKQLKTLLKRERKLTQFKLALIIGCPPSTLSRWMRGKFDPSPAWKNLLRLNPTLAELLNGEPYDELRHRLVLPHQIVKKTKKTKQI